MITCQNCGTGLTDDYGRVFGDNGGQVSECPFCPGSSMHDRFNGSTIGRKP